MQTQLLGSLAVRVLVLARTLGLVSGLCECGYSTTGRQGDDSGPLLFTDALESDFSRTEGPWNNQDWVRQQFNVSAEAGRGKYGKAFGLGNVGAAPSTGVQGRGMELRVGSILEDGAVPVAEVDSVRSDMHWGSYRAGMRLPAVRGTCAALFWYLNDTQEIDMEFLSQEYNADRHEFPVNLVVQSKEAMTAGFDASRTGMFRRVNLTFDPTAGFHEYGFDYLPGRVVFYADSIRLAEVKGGGEMPSGAGHLILQHWSNGNPRWSGGPPAQDAIMTVSYVKAYFNTSGGVREASGWSRRCADSGAAPCTIAPVTAANASTGGRFLTGGGNGHGGRGSADDSGSAGGGCGKTVVAAAAAAAMLLTMAGL